LTQPVVGRPVPRVELRNLSREGLFRQATSFVSGRRSSGSGGCGSGLARPSDLLCRGAMEIAVSFEKRRSSVSGEERDLRGDTRSWLAGEERRIRRRLRGFSEKDGQAPLGIEEGDLEARGCHGLLGTTTGRRDRREQSGGAPAQRSRRGAEPRASPISRVAHRRAENATGSTAPTRSGERPRRPDRKERMESPRGGRMPG